MIRLRPLGEDRIALLMVPFLAVTGPSDPIPAASCEQWVHGARESTGTAHCFPTFFGLLQCQRKPVRDYNETSSHKRLHHLNICDRLHTHFALPRLVSTRHVVCARQSGE